ncbi:hypothetical protein RND81_07G089100 [Saponaria officinalis]|uniref:Uncharacterized protein n=1 Tax=Saponaria officinalis TaxID=3572 RepID=A0AAW1JQM8_SAPOF
MYQMISYLFHRLNNTHYSLIILKSIHPSFSLTISPSPKSGATACTTNYHRRGSDPPVTTPKPRPHHLLFLPLDQYQHLSKKDIFALFAASVSFDDENKVPIFLIFGLFGFFN